MSQKPLPPLPLPRLQSSQTTPPGYDYTITDHTRPTQTPYIGSESPRQDGRVLRVWDRTTGQPAARAVNGFVRYSPVGLLPFELLASIFEYATEDDSLLLGRLPCVSRTWHDVVWNSQHLWARVNVIGPFRLYSIDSYRRHIDLCVEKSGAWPLHVTFDPRFPRFAPVETVKATHQLLTHLSTSASSKWTTFRYVLGVEGTDAYAVMPSTSESIINILDCTINLKYFALHACSRHLRNPWLWAHISTHQSLQTLELLTDGFSFDGVEFSNIRILTIHWTVRRSSTHRNSRVRPWLVSFPSLKKLILKGTDSRPIGTMPFNRHYVATHLHTLEMHGQPSTWNLSGAVFLALRRVIICAMPYSRHFLSDFEHLSDIDTNNVTHLTLSCAEDYPFWELGSEEDVLGSRYINQLNLQAYFQKFPVLETVKASGCIWRQIFATFDGFDEEIHAAAQGPCASHEISADKLYKFMVLQDVKSYALDD